MPFVISVFELPCNGIFSWVLHVSDKVNQHYYSKHGIFILFTDTSICLHFMTQYCLTVIRVREISNSGSSNCLECRLNYRINDVL